MKQDEKKDKMKDSWPELLAGKTQEIIGRENIVPEAFLHSLYTHLHPKM